MEVTAWLTNTSSNAYVLEFSGVKLVKPWIAQEGDEDRWVETITSRCYMNAGEKVTEDKLRLEKEETGYVFTESGVYILEVTASFRVVNFAGTKQEYEKDRFKVDEKKSGYRYALPPITITVTE